MAGATRIPEGLLAVHLSTKQSRAMAHLPELSAPTTLRVMAISVDAARDKRDQQLMVFEGSAAIADGLEMLRTTPAPVLGFNLFNHHYRALAMDYDLTGVIKKSIDVFLALWQLTNGASIAATGKPATSSGDLKLNSLMFDNFSDYRPDPDPRFRCKDVAALWSRVLSAGEVNVGGRAVALEPASIARLTGAAPFFSTPKAWASSLMLQGSVLGVTGRGFSKHRTKIFAPRYEKYLD